MIEAWNKIDAVDGERGAYLRTRVGASGLDGSIEAVCVSALTGEGVADLFGLIDAELSTDTKPLELILTPNQGDARAWLFRKGAVRGEQTDDVGQTLLSVRLNGDDAARFVARWPEILSEVPFSLLSPKPEPLHFLEA
jgi:GTPase